MQKKTIYKYFYLNYLKNKNAIFLNIEGKKYTYYQIFEKINLFENIFFNKKINTVGIIDHNSIYHVILYLICSKKNLMFIPFDQDINKNDLVNQIKVSGCNLIFCSFKISRKLKTDLKNKVQFENIEKKLSIKKLEKINKKTKNNFLLLCFTSGSTGDPKPIALSQQTKIDRAQSNINLYSLKNIKKSIISTPFHHTLAIRILTISILVGAEIFVIRNYNFSKFIELIKKKKIDFTIFIANQINDLIRNKILFKKIKSLKSLISSSSNLSFKNKQNVIKLFKGRIFECYGLSEAAIVTSLDIKNDKNHLGSVGKVIKNVKIKIYKKNKNSIGEILVKSKYIFSEYLNKKKYTRSLFKKNYFTTGDLGFLKHQYLYLVGRKKNMFKIKGISVYAEDIEKKINYSGLVKDCIVTSTINIHQEENICLIYVPKILRNSENKIKNFCLNNLSAFQLPRFYIQENVIPKNKLGKPDKKKIIDITNKYKKTA